MNIQGCFPLGLTGLISLLFKALSRVFSVPHFENSVDSTHFVKIFRNVLIKVTVHSNGLEVQQRALCLSYTVTFLGMIEIKTCKKQEVGGGLCPTRHRNPLWRAVLGGSLG